VPCHRQTAFRDFGDVVLPVTERAADRILSLPMSPTLTATHVERVCTVLQEALR
jgi:dTDP-4-amino-4,6-dideoxygalactose transaminase